MNVNIKSTNINFPSGKRIGKKPKSPIFSSKLPRKKHVLGITENNNKFSLQSLFKPDKKIKLHKKKKLEILYTFTNQLSILLDSGVSLIQCLSILSEQTENNNFKTIIEKITKDIEEGTSFSDSLSKYPDIFPNLFISMVQAAEKGGQLSQILKQLSIYMQEQDKLNKKLIAAMAYPKFVSIFFAFVLGAIIFGLVPKFQSIFKSFNAELPTPTQILINISQFAINHIIIEAVLVILFVIAFQKFKRTNYGKFFLDSLKLKLPVAGDIILKSGMSKFCRTLSILIQSGVSIVESLEIAASTAENVTFLKALQEVKKGVIEGETLHKKLSQNPIFPSLVVKMVATGEESGSLDKMLINISMNYDSNVDSKISALSSIIEPALMVALGAVSLVTVLCFYLPIFKIGSAIQ